MPTAPIHEELVKLNRKVDTICDLLHGLYRHSKAGLVQPALPGLAPDDTRHDAPDGCEWTMPPAGQVSRSLPRQWGSTVKVYEALFGVFSQTRFGTAELFGAKAVAAVFEATKGRIAPQTVARMMSALVRAGAAARPMRGDFRLLQPTDALREAVEREAARMNARRPARGEPSDLRTCEPSNGGREAARA